MVENKNDTELDRRTYLSALSAASVAGLAGCGGNGGGSGGDGDGNDSGGGDGGGDGDQELGERVPTLSATVLGGIAQSGAMEQTMGHISQVTEEHLGVPIDISVKELQTFWEEAYNDERNFNFNVDLSPPFMSSLDPANLLEPMHIQNAGANGLPNGTNLANCEFSQAFEEQAVAENEEQRRQAVNNALGAASADIAPISLVTNVAEGAYRTDQLNAQQMGESGINARNGEFLWNSEPTGDADALVSNMTPSNIDDPVYFTAAPEAPWSPTVYAPLFYYDRNYERQPFLAADFEVTNSQQTFTFNLREDATFHNGEPITAEDVKWTYEFMNQNPAEFPPVPEQPFESINVVDEKTVEINMTRPHAAFLNGYAAIWGILPSQVWIDAGAEENPANPDFDEIIGSGPYQVSRFQPQQLLALEPYEDHWVDATHDIIFRGYADRQAGFRAFQDGSINTLINLGRNTVDQINNNMSDVAEVRIAESFVSWELRSQHSFAPTMFTEFKHAVSQVINRQTVSQFFSGGEGEPELYSSYLGSLHPWYPENPDEVLTKIADSPEPNPERAREILEEEGWGWDDEGRLHYPPDKDLTPLWPEGSTPCENPDDFPCLPDLCPE